MVLTGEAKLYPNSEQQAILSALFENCRLFYNKVLETKINAYKENEKTISRFDLQKIFKGKNDIPATVRQMMIYRVNLAYERFFNKNGNFPRFKSFNRLRSIDLRQYGTDYRFKNDKLETFRIIGKIRMRGFKPAKEYKTGRIIKRASGWFVQYLYEQKEKTPKKRFNKKVGIDLGLKSFLVDSNKNSVIPPKFFKVASYKLAKAQRKLSKAIKGGGRRSKKRILVAKIHEKIANQRKDFLHKLSRQYANQYDLIAAEDLNIAGMVKNHHLARSIQDASWDTFINMLDYKMKILGHRLIKVNPRFTTKECSACGEMVTKSLSVRTHVCSCGFVADRDYNAALNILKKAQDELTARVVR